MAEENTDMKQMAATVRQLVNQMIANGRADLALQAIGMSNLELLRLEAARAQLSRLLITSDYRFLLPDYGNKEVEMSPIHKALYLLFLNHPDGIESKHLSDHRDELLSIYMRVSSWLDIDKVYDVVDRLVDPLDNAFNEKCSRIKAAFAAIMDEYSAAYYAISGHKLRHISASSRVIMTGLPRNSTPDAAGVRLMISFFSQSSRPEAFSRAMIARISVRE